ncbi:xanthine dehydrogenase accessory protein XdhC [Psychrobacter sp. 16-MNA-CIBAN-0192]|uniref:xanthine dehydrogenase accessory protein XdhC n=1 Tax=Psychrobacter sp. 16-MNA-CIBAN-0192 TaxID=3140448 RepID=UPI00332C4C2A
MSESLTAFISANSLMPPTRWYDGLAEYQQQGIAHVLATIAAVNGSAPRALQAKMIITQDSCCDTLGGGGLEHDVMSTARQLLNGEVEATVSKQVTDKKAVRRDAIYTKHYPLGAKLAQCCGGSVTVMFECFNVTPPLSILVFGAGHVAAALMTILAELPCQVDWVDSRPEMFEPYLLNKPQKIESLQQGLNGLDTPTLYQLPAHIRPHISDEPVDFVRPFIEPFNEQGSQRFILIMTHDHSLDFDLVRAAIDSSLANDNPRNSMPYIGCISSATKAKRFKDRLLQRGYSEQVVDNLTMPIGLPIGGKEPMTVAVSIAAQILQQYNHQL